MARAGGVRAGKAYVELYADNSKLVRGLRAAQQKLKAFGQKVGEVGRGMAMAGAAIVGPLVGAAKIFASMGDSVAKMAKRTGMSVEALSALSFAATRSGTNIESLENGLKRMQRTIYDAGRGLSTAVDGLADLGLTIADLNALSPEEQFKTMADRLAAIEDPTRKAALSMVLFGRAGTAMLPMIEQGRDGIEKLEAAAHRLGVVISTENAQAAEKLTDDLGDLWIVLKTVAFTVGSALAPVLTEAAQWFQESATRVREWANDNKELIQTALKVGVAVAAIGVALIIFAKVITVAGGVVGALKLVIVGVKAVAIAFTWLLAHPIVAGIAGITAVIGLLVFGLNEAKSSVQELGAEFQRLSFTEDSLDRAQAALEGARNLEQQEKALRRIIRLYEAMEKNLLEKGGEAVDFAIAEKIAAIRKAVEDQLKGVQAARAAKTKKPAKAPEAVSRDEEKKWADELYKLRIAANEDEQQRAIALMNDRYLKEWTAAKGNIGLQQRIQAAWDQERANLDAAHQKQRVTAAAEAAREIASIEKDQAERVAELRLRAQYDGVELAEKLLGLEERRALAAAKVAGTNLTMIEEEFSLRRKMMAAEQTAKLDSVMRQIEVRGTYSAAAARGLGAGSRWQAQTVKAQERTAKATEATQKGLFSLLSLVKSDDAGAAFL